MSKFIIALLGALLGGFVLADDLPSCESFGASFPECNPDLDAVYEDYPNPYTNQIAPDLPINGL